MFHLLTCFDLRPGVTVAEFQSARAKYVEHMQSQDLLVGVSPIGARQRDTVLDTDDRKPSHFFLMYFRDRVQADAATALIEIGAKESIAIHRTMYAMADNMAFLCWEDLPGL